MVSLSQKLKKILLIILGAFLILASIGPYFSVKAETKAIDGIREEIQESKKELKKIEESKHDIKKNLAEETAKLKEYQNEINNLEKEIEDLKRKKTQLEYDIKLLLSKIKEREEAIEEAEAQVKSYLVQAQSSLHVNSLFEFLMGSEDFATMILRLEGMSAIKRHNEKIIRKLADEKAALERDKSALEEKKKVYEASEEKLQVEVEKKKAYESKIKRVVQQLEEEERKLEKQAESINHKNEQQARKIKEIEAKIERERQARIKAEEEAKRKAAEQSASGNSGGQNVSGGGSPSQGAGGFIRPLPSGTYSVTASVWSYPWGTPHMGVDLGAAQGTPIYAVGNGIVVATNAGCPSPHGNNIGSYCGYGYGNFVSYIVNVNGHNYGIVAAHMSSVSVSSGQAISAGQVIGHVGNSGKSTGSHLHIETINMGGGGLGDAWARWNGSMNFGTGSAWSGGRRCDLGSGVPCRMNPHSLLGI